MAKEKICRTCVYNFERDKCIRNPQTIGIPKAGWCGEYKNKE